MRNPILKIEITAARFIYNIVRYILLKISKYPDNFGSLRKYR